MSDGDRIRVIVVDDIAETRENIRKLLQFEKDVEVVGVARTGKEGVQLALETRPDVIIMDINMPDMDGISATEAIRREVPYCQIVILSVQGDPNYMRRAMLAGARDFITKPPTVDELTAAVKRAGRVALEERLKTQAALVLQSGARGLSVQTMPTLTYGKIIVVYSPKGGAGCTTLATNLAVTLQTDETPVVIVDGDLQFGDVAVFLNLQGKNSIIDLALRADELDPEIIEEVALTHVNSGIKVLAAPSRPEYAESVTGEQFGKVLHYLRRLFSYIVVDTASSLSDITLAAMDVADLIILLTTQEIPAIKNSRLFLDLADVLKIQRNRILFVMNKFDKRIGITPQKISESFKFEMTAVIPFEDRVVIPSINRGVPFMSVDRSRPISRSILALVEAMRQRLSTLEPVENFEAAIRLSKV